MKRVKEQIKYLALLAICLLSGCSDFLDSYNPSAVTDDFYNTKEGQKKLLTDINARYRNVFNTGELQYYGTDIYMAISEEPAERMFNGYDKTFNSTAPIVGDYWKVLYKIVQESNILLNRCTPDIAGNDYTSLTAQARFFRAILLTPGAQMNFIDAHGLLFRVFLSPLGDPVCICPGKAGEVGCYRSGAGSVFCAESKGIGLIKDFSRIGSNGKFVEFTCFHTWVKVFPDSHIRDFFHGIGIRVPAIEVAYQMNLLCMRSPNGKINP